MGIPADFTARLELKVAQQLKSQRVGYLLGAGSSYLNGAGFPLASQLWDRIRAFIGDVTVRDEIQAKLDSGAMGIEHALDLLDEGLPQESPHRRVVTNAIAGVFRPIRPPLENHVQFLRRLAARSEPHLKIFNLNYDPLVEWSAEQAHIRLLDGFCGNEHAYFAPEAFEERIGRIRGSYKAKQFDETTKPIQLLKLHGSIGWCECSGRGIRRCLDWYECSIGNSSSCPFATVSSPQTKILMIPPQRRKASDTMSAPYAALWSTFRGALGQDAAPLHRLACLGYGFGDEHVNTVIEAALARTDFTLLAFARAVSDEAWSRWSVKKNAVIVTESRSSLNGERGAGHLNLWDFARIVQEV
jgi:hypothetical protein